MKTTINYENWPLDALEALLEILVVFEDDETKQDAENLREFINEAKSYND